jgi:hypothetical protein
VLRDMSAAGAMLAPDDPAINDIRTLVGVSEAEPMSLEELALVRGDPPKPDPNAPDPNAPTPGGKDGKGGGKGQGAK